MSLRERYEKVLCRAEPSMLMLLITRLKIVIASWCAIGLVKRHSAMSVLERMRLNVACLCRLFSRSSILGHHTPLARRKFMRILQVHHS